MVISIIVFSAVVSKHYPNIATLRNDFESGTMLSSLDPKSLGIATVIGRQIPVARKLKLLLFFLLII